MFPTTKPVVIADVTKVGASYCETQLTIFNQIQFWSQYSANQKSIFSVMNKRLEEDIGQYCMNQIREIGYYFCEISKE